jgi:hypothetical protein
MRSGRSLIGLTAAALASAPLLAQAPRADLANLGKQRCPKPVEFALVFSFGYAGDHLPSDDTRFDQLLQTIREAGFNTIHCIYTDRRLELCKKRGIKMMVDLLAEQHHVYQSPAKARAVCEKLRDHPAAWGYNIWNDSFGKSGAGRRRDVNAVRQWDPTHPAYVGTYRTHGMSELVNADIIGYYDFHWKRGTGQHFPHLLAYRSWAREHDAWFYTWLSATSGQAGKGNFNRCLYSANTGIACGLKGILWFLGPALMNSTTQEWTEAGRDVARVNKEVLPLARELAKLGNPSAVYSTPITRTLNNEPLPDGRNEALPPGLGNNAFPKDFWIQPAGGEFLLGVFQDDRKRDLIFLANHNAYAAQDVALRVSREVVVRLFNRREGRWQPLAVGGGVVRLRLGPAGGELLLLGE